MKRKAIIAAIVLLAVIPLGAQTVKLTPVPKIQFLDTSGDPLASGKVFTYIAGTTTNQVTYTDSTAATPNANPVILDSGGFPDSGEIWLDVALSYKFVVKSSTDVTQYTVDNVTVAEGLNKLKGTYTTTTFSATPTFNAAVADIFDITLTGNVTSSTISNATTGDMITIILRQDGTGGRTFVWPSDSVQRLVVVDTTASAVTVVSYTYDGSNWEELNTSGEVIGPGNINNVRFVEGVKFAQTLAGINAAIVETNAAGGGIVYVPDNYAGTIIGQIELKSNVHLIFGADTYTNTGASGGVMVNAASAVTNCKVSGAGEDITILKNNSTGTQFGAVVQFTSTTNCAVANITLDGNDNTTNPLITQTDSGTRIRNVKLLASTTVISGLNYAWHARGSDDLDVLNLETVGGSLTGIQFTTTVAFTSMTGGSFVNVNAHDSPWNAIGLAAAESGTVISGMRWVNIRATDSGTKDVGDDDQFGLSMFGSSGGEVRDNVFINITTTGNTNAGIRLKGKIFRNTFWGINSRDNATGTIAAAPVAAIAIMNGAAGEFPTDNYLQGIARGNGQDALLTESNSIGNTFDLNIGSNSTTLGTTANIHRFVTDTAGVVSTTALRFDKQASSASPAAPSISNVSGVGLTLEGATVVVNNLAAATDFIVKGDNDVKLIFVDGGDDAVMVALKEDSLSTVRHWIYKLVEHGDMTASATADTFTLWTLPANTIIYDVFGNVTVAWAGTGPVSAAVCSVGTNAGAANDLTLDDNFFAVQVVYELHDATASGGKGTLIMDSTDKFAPYSFLAGGVVEIQCDLTGGDHDNTTAGSAQIAIEISQPLANTTVEAN